MEADTCLGWKNRTPAKIYTLFDWLVQNKGTPKKQKAKRGANSGEDVLLVSKVPGVFSWMLVTPVQKVQLSVGMENPLFPEKLKSKDPTNGHEALVFLQANRKGIHPIQDYYIKTRHSMRQLDFLEKQILSLFATMEFQETPLQMHVLWSLPVVPALLVYSWYSTGVDGGLKKKNVASKLETNKWVCARRGHCQMVDFPLYKPS